MTRQLATTAVQTNSDANLLIRGRFFRSGPFIISIVSVLTFGVLRCLACAFEPVFLSFLDAGIAGQQAVLPQRALEAIIKINQGAGDAVLDGAGLAGHSATGNLYLDIVFTGSIGNHESLLYHAPVVNQREKLLVGLAVDNDIAGADDNLTCAIAHFLLPVPR